MFGLVLLFVYVFFCPFSILITLLGEEGAGLCAYRAFVCLLYKLKLCHVFSSSWCCGLAAASACGSSWIFLFTFLMFRQVSDITQTEFRRDDIPSFCKRKTTK